jgi:hypothetical protein
MKQPQKCSCGSGMQRQAVYDGHNIFLTFACDRCRLKKLAEFRPDVLEFYTTDEPIEAE